MQTALPTCTAAVRRTLWNSVAALPLVRRRPLLLTHDEASAADITHVISLPFQSFFFFPVFWKTKRALSLGKKKKKTAVGSELVLVQLP